MRKSNIRPLEINTQDNPELTSPEPTIGQNRQLVAGVDITLELPDEVVSSDKVEKSALEKIYEDFSEALKSPQAKPLAVKIHRKDDQTYVISQGLKSNIWGRLEADRVIVYNSRLRRLFNNHPITKKYTILSS